MVQLRLMGDDADRVREVAALVMAALRGHPALQLGDAAELTNRRGPGVRVVFDVSTANAAGPYRVHAERVDVDPAAAPARQRRARRPPALGAG
ncbi:hypothetical protein [Nonomuraea rhodomycinica]|uniref:Uncharacterized protein n=1 Tax=Nonomuraea rhodomycinica TaxID=1712872 RepID=A0A7Y6IZ00_9ACTN|nr:hypothetical protein [Nonomuraea rhodomycinica]NUW47006.1 hypothetical protein [Nonomuraea rhodomycinica]